MGLNRSEVTGATPTFAARDDYAGRLDELQSALGRAVTEMNIRTEYLEELILGLRNRIIELQARIVQLEGVNR